jgi:glucose-6-phosphate isomerase
MDQTEKTRIWKALETDAQSLRLHLSQHITQKPNSDQKDFHACSSNIHLDYSNQHISPQTLKRLIALAEACRVREKINALMNGEPVNISESRPALHTALRAKDGQCIMVNQRNVMTEITATRGKIKEVVERIRSNNWLGFSGKPITDIVNIGIGGSDLGPRFCIKALADFSSKQFNYHFISDADPYSFEQTVARLHPETTLFIISSKSFTTRETLYNAQKAMSWIGSPNGHKNHFIAITAQIEKAHEFGVTTVLPIWDWVGGRYSFCSAINLIGAIAIGFEQFGQILSGANSMDEHFQNSDFSCNLPVILALMGIWNNNFLHIHNLLVLTYAQNLEYFVPYLQQLDMESNGKSINQQGAAVHYATAPIVWGGSGNQAQHSYYQLLCQGTHQLTADFISLEAYDGQIINQFCQDKIKLLTSGVNPQNNPEGFIPGNIPLNHLRLSHYSPFTIGALVALYEHKTFTQSIIWDINPFDQPGVESAKKNNIRELGLLNIL